MTVNCTLRKIEGNGRLELTILKRPYCFRKSLNMSKLQAFLEIGCDKFILSGKNPWEVLYFSGMILLCHSKIFCAIIKLFEIEVFIINCKWEHF